jgi:deferrochelatase/peroxidase EfeB
MRQWHVGAPIDLTPLKDDPHLAKDPSRNNNFRYDIEDPDKEERCPFAAHTRKTNPRSDLDPFGGTEIRRIIRRGIPFGPEVSREEAALNKTFHHRGLLFVAYQSNIGNGFRFIQTSR